MTVSGLEVRVVFVTEDFYGVLLGFAPSVSVEIYAICLRVFAGSLVSLDVIVCGLCLVVKNFIRCRLGFCIGFTWPEGCLRLFLVLFYFLV